MLLVFHIAQQVILAAQLVPRFHTIGRCNNYAVLQSIPCFPECKIIGQILLDHPLSYALTATADVLLCTYNNSGGRSTPSAHKTPTLTASPQGKKRKQSAGESSALCMMCRRQGYMIQNMEQKCVTTKKLWKTHTQVNQVLHLGVSQLVEKSTKELIENNLKPCIAAMTIEDSDAFHLETPDLVSQEFNAQAPKIIEELFKNYIQSNVIQVHPTTSTSTDTISLADLQQQLDDNIHSHHDDHQEDDAPLEGEKSVTTRVS
ncbi:hypothetical protein Tco_0759377, partial [Tanacetum coccineum]